MTASCANDMRERGYVDDKRVDGGLKVEEQTTMTMAGGWTLGGASCGA